MSRFTEYDGDDETYNGNGWAMWAKRAELALNGKRGRKALADLREALTALPEPRLVESVMCTPRTEAPDAKIVGYDVCVIGAYVWHQGRCRFDARGEDDEFSDAGAETARIGKQHGLTFTLAWELASMNDEELANLSPERRWARFIAYIDSVLASPPLKAAPRRVKRVRRRVVTRLDLSPTVPMGLV